MAVELVTVPTRLAVPGRVVSVDYLISKSSADPRSTTVGLAAGQESDGGIRIGSTRAFDEAPVLPPDEVEALLRDAARPYLGGIADLPVARHTVGFRVVSETGRAQVGGVPGVAGLYVNTGHGGDGVALAPLAGVVVAQHVLGEEPETWAFEPAISGG